MSKRMFITRKENALPGHKTKRDKLTFLLCGNASDNCKVNTLLVYHSETPKVFSRNNMIKSKLCVIGGGGQTRNIVHEVNF